jgi:hypothetical protein
MGTDVFVRNTGVISARWRMRVVLAALVIGVVAWSYIPTPHLVGSALVLLLTLVFLRRRARSLPAPPWVPPWQEHTGLIDHRRLQAVAPARRPHRRSRARGPWGALAAVQTVSAQMRVCATCWAQVFAALPSQLPRPAPITPTVMPATIATLNAVVDHALADAGVAGQVAAIERTSRSASVSLQTHELSPAQTLAIRTTLRMHAPTVRWTGTQRLAVSLPLAASLHSTHAPLCVPILRRGAMTVWWPLRETRPLILAGDALPFLHVLLSSLASAPRLLLYDPEQTLTAQTSASACWPIHMPDALASASTHALRTAFCRTQTPDMSPSAPLTLVVVAPDAAAWRDLTPLLSGLDGGVQLVLALTAGASHPAAQDACRLGQVVEIGAYGREALPEACRPPGLVPPRPGMALAWQTPQRFWRGTPIRRNAP